MAMNSTVILYSGVKFTKNYDDVVDIYGSNLIAALNSHAVLTVSDFSFIRKTGQIQINCTYATALTVNYMAFKNTNYSSKWFFAFVDNIEYRNEHAILIDYTIDIWHTYMVDGSYLDCYVQREHVSNDTNKKNNLVVEPIQPKTHVCDSMYTKALTDWCIVVCYTAKSNEDYAGCIIGNKMVSAGKLKKIVINISDNVPSLADFKTFVDTFQGDFSSIISMFMYPADFAATSETYSNPVDETFTISPFSSVQGYTPRNLKCLTYPYTYILADSGDAVNTYRLEYFTLNMAEQNPGYKFLISGAKMPTAELDCFPIAYNGSSTGQPNVTEKLPMASFPQVAFPIDSYKAWLAQCQSSALIGAAASFASSAVGNAGSAAIGGSGAGAAVGVASSAVGGALGFWATDTAAQDASNKWTGSQTASIEIAKGLKGFRFKVMCPPVSELKAIDDYFSMFGYQVNRVKTPNTHTRQHWNYIQTSGQAIAGTIPQEALSKLNELCNRGITIWHNYDRLGHYYDNNNNMDNPVVQA